MSLYFDACALVPIFVREEASDRINAYLDQQISPLNVSDLAIGEIASALSRRVREGKDRIPTALATLAALDDWVTDAAIRLAVEPGDVRRADNIVRQFTLKLLMPDAIHAAICGRLGLTLVTLDRRLATAADRLGVAVVTPQ